MPLSRTSLIASSLAVLALAAAGCGGSEVSADEVPGAPVSLTVPSDSVLGAGGSSATDNGTSAAEPGATPTPDASSDSGASGTGAADGGAAAGPADTGDGAAVPEATTAPSDTAASDQPPAAGSAPQQFESFCEQNAGAC